MDYEQFAQENAMFPWLDSDCMSDIYDEETKFDVEDYYDDFSFSDLINSENDF